LNLRKRSPVPMIIVALDAHLRIEKKGLHGVQALSKKIC